MKFKIFTIISSVLLVCTGFNLASAATLPKPTNATAEVQGADINISFAGIAGNNYIAACREYINGNKGTLSAFKTSFTSPITIKNLKQNSTYRCYIANNTGASKNWDNVVGSDQDTATFDWVQVLPTGYTNGASDLILTKTSNNAPSNIRIVPAATSIAVFFNYPSNASSVSATCSPKNGGAQLTLSSDSSPIVLMSANASSVYSCYLTAYYANGVNSNPSTTVEITIPATTTGVPSAPGIGSVLLKGNQLVVTVIPPLNGSAVTSFNATCTNTGNGKIFTNTSSTYKVSMAVDQLASYSCTASAQGPYGRSAESSVFLSTESKNSNIALRFKLESPSQGGSYVTLTAPYDSSAVSVKFSCLGQSTQNYGKEVWGLSLPVTGKSPFVKLDLSYGDWGCIYQNTTNSGLGLESARVKVSVTLPAPAMKVIAGKLVVSKPATWSAPWSVVCSGSDSTQVVKTSSSSTLTLKLSKGSWKCAGSLNGQITSLKSVKV